MTANHAHTPTTDYLGNLIWETIHNDVYETDLSVAGAYNLVAKIMASEWYAAQIAAAEQRGAVMVMDALKREASDSSWEGIVQPGRSLQELVDHIDRLLELEKVFKYRADRLEADHAG